MPTSSVNCSLQARLPQHTKHFPAYQNSIPSLKMLWSHTAPTCSKIPPFSLEPQQRERRNEKGAVVRQVIKAPSLPKKDHTCHRPHLNGFEKSSRLQQPKYMPGSGHRYNCKIREHIFPAVINTLISANHWHYQKAFTIAKSKNVCNPSIEFSQRLPCELFRGKRFIRYATEYKNKACSSFHVRNKFVHGEKYNSNIIIIVTQASQRALCHWNLLLYKAENTMLRTQGKEDSKGSLEPGR